MEFDSAQRWLQSPRNAENGWKVPTPSAYFVRGMFGEWSCTVKSWTLPSLYLGLDFSSDLPTVHGNDHLRSLWFSRFMERGQSRRRSQLH